MTVYRDGGFMGGGSHGCNLAREKGGVGTAAFEVQASWSNLRTGDCIETVLDLDMLLIYYLIVCALILQK